MLAFGLGSGIAGLGGVALSQGLKALFGRARPDAALQLVDAINASFPSGHAMLSAVVWLTLGGIYAIAALGIALIFGVMKLVNFAHGQFIAFAVFALIVPSTAGGSTPRA